MNSNSSQISQLINDLAERLFQMSISETIFKIGLNHERWKAELYAACKALESLTDQGISSKEAFSKAEPIVVERLEHYKAYGITN